jgi:hypothetical protein
MIIATAKILPLPDAAKVDRLTFNAGGDSSMIEAASGRRRPDEERLARDQRRRSAAAVWSPECGRHQPRFNVDGHTISRRSWGYGVITSTRTIGAVTYANELKKYASVLAVTRK